MNKQELAASLKRIDAFYGGKDEVRIESYINAIYEQCSWMSSERFDDVCRHMVPNLNPIKRPMAKSYLDGYYALFPNEKNFHAGESCSSCSGAGMTFEHITKSETGDTYTACRPCPQCRPDAKYWTLKKGFVVSSEPFSSLASKAEKLTPRQAQYVLEQKDCEKLPQEVVKILIDKTTDTGTIIEDDEGVI